MALDEFDITSMAQDKIFNEEELKMHMTKIAHVLLSAERGGKRVMGVRSLVLMAPDKKPAKG